jgi:hypothetical protein
MNKLKNYINLNNHKTVVVYLGIPYELVSYKNSPRAVYCRIPDPNGDGISHIMRTTGISNMPIPIKGIKYVVSREVIRATRVLESRILRTHGLEQWLKQQGIKDFSKKVKFLKKENIAKEWPEFDNWLNKNKKEGRIEFFQDIKKYVGRNDLYAPGPKIRGMDNSVQACDGLISNLDEDIYEDIHI